MKKEIENNRLKAYIETFESSRKMMIKTKIDSLKLNI
jgi:hypothetical protein